MSPELALKTAQDAYSSSTTFVDANYRKQWETNLRMFQSKHPQDSKYHSENYKYRSKIFRPKTRAAGRKLEAAVAAAFFSNMDVVNVEAANQKDQKAIDAAKVRKELMQYRLTKTIPWFMTVIGGTQDAYTIGVVCSYQYWEYREKRTKRQEPVLDEMGIATVDLDGQPLMRALEDVTVLKDEPCIDLIPVENIRISPAAKWHDPIGTSPYVIELIPMYVCDVREMMDSEDPKTGQPAWKKYEDGEIKAATKHNYDSTRQTREGHRQDSQQPNEALGEYEIVWVHRNIIKSKGDDFVYYTLGTEHLLTDPKPLKEVYFHGVRPYVMGVAQIESHKIYPQSPTEMGGHVQSEINEVANQRLDNVKLVLNKRYIVKRGAQVDLKSLVRNVPASVTMANSVTDDVREIEFNDVTSSSYQEHDRLNVEYDELVGNFSQGSVMTNRKLNETVGGMSMMNQGASQMTEYTIRTLTETWIEPVLQQLDALESAYETDENVLRLIGEKAQVEVTPDMLTEEVMFTVSVGMGATDPMQRVQRILAATQALVQMLANPIPGLKVQEIVKEVFGAIGYRDGGRFISEEEEDPKAMVQQLQQMVQKLQQELQQAEIKLADKSQKDQIQAAVAEQNMQANEAKARQEMQQDAAEFMQNMRQQMAEFAQTMQQNQREFEQSLVIIKEDAAARREMAEKTASAKADG